MTPLVPPVRRPDRSPNPPAFGTTGCRRAFFAHGPQSCPGGFSMRGILLWAIGIPIPVIILLYLFNVF
jgi:hypothetical protein